MDEPSPSSWRALWERLSREQRIAFWILAVCGFFALGLSVLALQDRLQGSFFVPLSLFRESQDFFQNEQKIMQANDVLTRWEAYRESLATLEARQAVACAPGSPCDQSSADTVPETSATSVREALGVTGPRPVMDASLAAVSSSGSVTSTLSALSGVRPPSQMSAADIRAYLSQRHLIPADQLRAMSDAQVTSLYQSAYDRAMAQEGAAPFAPAPAAPAPSP